MKYSDNAVIIQEYRNVFRKYAGKGVIDMDACLKHTFSFQIHRLEEVVSAWDGIIPAYRQSQFLIALIKKGMGTGTIGHFTFPIENNTLLVVPQRVLYSSKYFTPECSGFMLSFDMALFSKQFFPRNIIASKRIFKKSVKPFTILTNEQSEDLSAISEYLIEESNLQRIDKDEMIAVKILELLLQCDRYFSGAAPYQNLDSYSEIIESFNELIQDHFSKEKSVQFYANALHIHPNYLNFLMKKYTGMTAKQMIVDHLFLEAKALLASDSLTIKEISYILGFSSPDCFSSFFRKLSNISPSKFRRQVPRL
jgi:AraC family transcriptional regulator, transcriptional activator of pobA